MENIKLKNKFPKEVIEALQREINTNKNNNVNSHKKKKTSIWKKIFTRRKKMPEDKKTEERIIELEKSINEIKELLIKKPNQEKNYVKVPVEKFMNMMGVEFVE